MAVGSLQDLRLNYVFFFLSLSFLLFFSCLFNHSTAGMLAAEQSSTLHRRLTAFIFMEIFKHIIYSSRNRPSSATCQLFDSKATGMVFAYTRITKSFALFHKAIFLPLMLSFFWSVNFKVVGCFCTQHAEQPIPLFLFVSKV